jgi:hypothetical protein
MTWSDVMSEDDSEQDQILSPLDAKSKKRQKKPEAVSTPESSDNDESLSSEIETDMVAPALPNRKHHLDKAPSPIFEKDVKRAAAQRASRPDQKRNTLTRLAANLDDLSLNNNIAGAIHGSGPPQKVASKEDTDMKDSDWVRDPVVIFLCEKLII